MWKSHLIVCLVLIAIAIPIAIIDLTQMGKSGGGWIYLDLRGIFIVPYLTFLAVHVALSTTWVRFLSPAHLIQVHLISGILSIIILTTGFWLYTRYEDKKDLEAHELRMQEIAVLREVINLKSWKYVPDNTNPEEIQIRLLITESGRFAGHVEGREAGEYGEQVFYSEDIPQRQVKAGEEFTETYPLKFYKDSRAESISFMLSLFKDEIGSAPENISVIFIDQPTTDFDGHFIYKKLPQPEN